MGIERIVVKAAYMKGILKNVVKCAQEEVEVMDMKGANIKGIISKVPKSAQEGVEENKDMKGANMKGILPLPQGVLGHGLDDHLLRCSFCCFI